LSSHCCLQVPVLMEGSSDDATHEWQKVFSQIDVDGDGLVTEDELLQFLCTAGVEPDEMSALFASLDVDKDDSITSDEFEAGFSAYKSIIGGSIKSGCASDALAVFGADEEEGEEGTQVELRQPRSSRNKKGKLLTSSEVFVRIRPKADEGGHAEGDAVTMGIEKYDDKSITLNQQFMFSDESNKYSFPRVVFPPECNQDDVYNRTMPALVDAFTQPNGTNVHFLAYGQTGTGKTHTMFGTDDSLQSAVPHEGWGIFPRTAAAVFGRIQEQSSQSHFVLQGSAVEFYMAAIYDLLADSAPIGIDKNGNLQGESYEYINSVAEIAPFIGKVVANRTVAHTKMNMSKSGHGGSSRSHSAIILTLHQLNKASGEFVTTSFTLMDLAGAERVSKTGADFMSPSMITMMVAAGKPMTAEQTRGSEGFMINFELAEMRTEVIRATEQHMKGAPYSGAPEQTSTPMGKYMGAAYTGKSLLGMMVCLSQAPQHGWETWFSMQYGTDLAGLKAPVKAQKPRKIKALRKSSKKAAKEAADAIKGGPPKEGSSAAKYYPGRVAMAKMTADFVDVLTHFPE